MVSLRIITVQFQAMVTSTLLNGAQSHRSVPWKLFGQVVETVILRLVSQRLVSVRLVAGRPLHPMVNWQWTIRVLFSIYAGMGLVHIPWITLQ